MTEAYPLALADIYIYIERERVRERESDAHIHKHKTRAQLSLSERAPVVCRNMAASPPPRSLVDLVLVHQLIKDGEQLVQV
jgi:hypothetical protein